jgi:hypothetical protein
LLRSFRPWPRRETRPAAARILRLIALERSARGVLLLAAGAYLITHLGSDFGRIADHAIRAVELDPRRPFLHRIISRLHRLHARTLLVPQSPLMRPLPSWVPLVPPWYQVQSPSQENFWHSG